MAYFDTVHNDSTFQQKALSERAKKLNLVLTKDSTPVSSWGRKHLFALRVLCKQPRMNGNLLFLECYIPKNEVPFDPCIQALVDGPGRSIQMLPKISESRFARLYNSELGGIWAALGALLEQRDNGDSQEQQKEAERRRPSRNRREPERLGNPIPTDNALFAFGIPKSDSSSSAGSVGYTENPQDPPVEDLTLRLVARFVRFVLIHGREVDNIEEPDVLVAQFRDKKLSTSYQLQNGPRRVIRAIDDGGVRLFSSDTEESPIVALMEAKRRFQNVGDGKPVVWDEVLAQMTGQALLALLDDTCRPISRTRQVPRPPLLSLL
jgi:hypothetical protein